MIEERTTTITELRRNVVAAAVLVAVMVGAGLWRLLLG